MLASGVAGRPRSVVAGGVWRRWAGRSGSGRGGADPRRVLPPFRDALGAAGIGPCAPPRRRASSPGPSPIWKASDARHCRRQPACEAQRPEPVLRPPGPLVEAFYRVRFGGLPLDNPEREAVEHGLAELEWHKASAVRYSKSEADRMARSRACNLHCPRSVTARAGWPGKAKSHENWFGWISRSGKSTLFEWLTGVRPDPALAHTAQSAMAAIPEPRVEALCKIYKPKKVTHGLAGTGRHARAEPHATRATPPGWP